MTGSLRGWISRQLTLWGRVAVVLVLAVSVAYASATLALLLGRDLGTSLPLGLMPGTLLALSIAALLEVDLWLVYGVLRLVRAWTPTGEWVRLALGWVRGLPRRIWAASVGMALELYHSSRARKFYLWVTGIVLLLLGAASYLVVVGLSYAIAVDPALLVPATRGGLLLLAETLGTIALFGLIAVFCTGVMATRAILSWRGRSRVEGSWRTTGRKGASGPPPPPAPVVLDSLGVPYGEPQKTLEARPDTPPGPPAPPRDAASGAEASFADVAGDPSPRERELEQKLDSLAKEHDLLLKALDDKLWNEEESNIFKSGLAGHPAYKDFAIALARLERKILLRGAATHIEGLRSGPEWLQHSVSRDLGLSAIIGASTTEDVMRRDDLMGCFTDPDTAEVLAEETEESSWALVQLMATFNRVVLPSTSVGMFRKSVEVTNGGKGEWRNWIPGSAAGSDAQSPTRG